MGARNVILKKRLTKRAAKKHYAEGKAKTRKRGKWKVDTAASTSHAGEISFVLKRAFVYRVVVPATPTSESCRTRKIRRR